MKLHQENDKIIVTELRPMSEAPDHESILIKLLNNKTRLYPGFLKNIYIHIYEFDKPRNISEADGFIPMPIYQSEKS